MNDTDKLQTIYDMEQNITLRWFWDGGVMATFGDSVNGCLEKNFETVAEAVSWLYVLALDRHERMAIP